MTYCNSCKGLGGAGCGIDGEENCCWARAIAVKKFKKQVLKKYIFEVVFDVVVSVASVVTDVASIIMSILKGRWTIAVVTAIPVLLPTIIFTNVYLADESQGVCKLPKHRRHILSRTVSESDDKESTATTATATTGKVSSTDTPMEQFNSKMDFHCGTCHMIWSSCSGCWGGMVRTICHKDQETRSNGAKTVRKSVKRVFKYLFGTFVLRYISLTWYAKAFMFGVRAYKEPKKYMKIRMPNTHWSYDLLVKLDFLQAALENAPQCVVQLYVLLVYSDENPILGMLTLLFSFMDFVRVSVSVQWDIHKGPVLAPSGCYDSYWWKLMNMLSWIFLYIGRSAALALVIATAINLTIIIPVVILFFHVVLFAKLFSKAKYGVAAQKVFVSVFISVFFLPEFDSTELPLLIKFYYAVIHIENLFFIVPWNGMDYDYCYGGLQLGGFRPPPRPRDSFNSSLEREYTGHIPPVVPPEEDSKGCLIDPLLIVIAVPALTMIGMIMRLAASNKMCEFKKTLPPRDDTTVMEERIADIYSKKWTSMTFDVLFKAFLKLLKNDVIKSDGDGDEKLTSAIENPVFIISPSFNKEFQASQQFFRAISFAPAPKDGECFPQDGSESVKTKRSMSVDACSGLPPYQTVLTRNFERVNGRYGHFLGVDVSDIRKRSKSQDDINFKNRRNAIHAGKDEIQFGEGCEMSHHSHSEVTWM